MNWYHELSCNLQLNIHGNFRNSFSGNKKFYFVIRFYFCQKASTWRLAKVKTKWKCYLSTYFLIWEVIFQEPESFISLELLLRRFVRQYILLKAHCLYHSESSDKKDRVFELKLSTLSKIPRLPQPTVLLFHCLNNSEITIVPINSLKGLKPEHPRHIGILFSTVTSMVIVYTVLHQTGP